MTGNELVRAIKAHRGKINIPMLVFQDVTYIYAEKQDLIRYFSKFGDNETRSSFRLTISGEFGDEAFVDVVD